MKRVVLGALGCLLALGVLFHPSFIKNEIPLSQPERGIFQHGTKNQAAAAAAAADKAMQSPIPLLTDKEIAPPGGDKRDYTSLAVYYWPDAAKPDGKPYVRRDGQVNPEKWDETRYDAKRLVQMKNAVKALARGYAATGNKAYADRARAIARAWFLDDATRMNPCLLYAQRIPGKTEGQKTGLIDTVNLIDVVDSLYLLQDACPAEEWQAYRQWFGAYTHWLLTSPLGWDEAASANNHGLWYDAQVCVFAHFAGQDETARKILQAVPEKRMAVQIAEDGSLPLELARTRPLHYSLYTLRACLTLARVGEEVGVPLYDAVSSNGRSLKLAIDYILPYAKGEKALPRKDIAKDDEAPFWHALHLANRHYHNPAYEYKPRQAD